MSNERREWEQSLCVEMSRMVVDHGAAARSLCSMPNWPAGAHAIGFDLWRVVGLNLIHSKFQFHIPLFSLFGLDGLLAVA